MVKSKSKSKSTSESLNSKTVAANSKKSDRVEPITKKSVTSSKKKSSSSSKPTEKKSKSQSKVVTELGEDEEEDEEEDEDEDESIGSSDEEHEEGKDVSERGMQRLMKALGQDGLDEFDSALLQADDQDEEDEEEDDEEEEEDDGEEEMEEQEDQEKQTSSKTPKPKSDSHSNSNSNSLAESILRSGLVPEDESEDEEGEDEEEDEEDEEDSGSDNEDLLTSNPNDDSTSSLPSRSKKGKGGEPKVFVNNEEAMLRLYDEIRIAGPPVKKDGKGKGAEMPWIEHMAVTHDQDLGIEAAENDLERELAFYKQSLASAIQAQKRYATLNIPFSRPNDFFAEMVKTDEHMERVRQRLLDERAGIKASEEAKRQRELKKFGKKVQVEKTLERQREKKRLEESVKGLKRKRQGGLETDGGEDDFDIRLASGIEEDSNDRSSSRGRGRGRGKGKDGRAKMPRNSRDSKYGFGGKKRHAKENTAESTGDFGREKSGRGGARGGRGRGRGGSRGGSSSRGKVRPGKSKRTGRN